MSAIGANVDVDSRVGEYPHSIIPSSSVAPLNQPFIHSVLAV